MTSRKTVQMLNPFLSIFALLFFILSLRKLSTPLELQLILLSFIAFLPRDIFTSAMVGNDVILELAAMGSAYFFIRLWQQQKLNQALKLWDLVLLMTFLIVGVTSKQHGLLLLLLPAALWMGALLKKQKSNFRILIVLALPLLFATSEEIWNYSHTGKFMVSNQHHFNYAQNQFPGSVEKVEFASFRLMALYQEPYYSESTGASIPTELFARSFFDYEWHFITPKWSSSKILAQISYSLGLLWILLFLWIFRAILWPPTSPWRMVNLANVLLLLALLYFAVPFLQTLRLPYYSSMKALFLLPGIYFFGLAVSRHAIPSKRFLWTGWLLSSIYFINTFALILSAFLFLIQQKL